MGVYAQGGVFAEIDSAHKFERDEPVRVFKTGAGIREQGDMEELRSFEQFAIRKGIQFRGLIFSKKSFQRRCGLKDEHHRAGIRHPFRYARGE